MNPIPHNFPEDLWHLFEQTTKHPSTTLKLHTKDVLDDPHKLTHALIFASRRERKQSPMVRKAIRWPEETLGEIDAASSSMHLTRDQYLRLVLEWVVADFHNSHPNAGT